MYLVLGTKRFAILHPTPSPPNLSVQKKHFVGTVSVEDHNWITLGRDFRDGHHEGYVNWHKKKSFLEARRNRPDGWRLGDVTLNDDLPGNKFYLHSVLHLPYLGPAKSKGEAFVEKTTGGGILGFLRTPNSYTTQ